MIMVVNSTATDAENLKRFIQFMDAPCVCVATPAEWLQRIGERRLEAVFVGPDVSNDEVDTIVSEVGGLDPNVPIVMLQQKGAP